MKQGSIGFEGKTFQLESDLIEVGEYQYISFYDLDPEKNIHSILKEVT